MPRPRKCRCVMHEPSALYFKPRGIPMVCLEQVQLTFDELEAIRLNDLEGLGQIASAEKMQISQPTLHRTLVSARKKIADALVNGKALKIEGGTYKLTTQRKEQVETTNSEKCRECDKPEVEDKKDETTRRKINYEQG